MVGNLKLPHDFNLNSVVNIQSGRTYDRQQWVHRPNRGWSEITTEPASDSQRMQSQFLWDLGIGKHFGFGKDRDFSIYLQILNLLNDDSPEEWRDYKYPANEQPISDEWVKPRRAELRLRIAF